MPPTRKRSDAFEDFPAGDALAKTTGQPGQSAQKEQATASQVERIERLKPSQMLPDRFQPRRLLPSSVREDFFSGRINCYQAASRWLELGKHEPGYQAELERLLAMGESFDEHGQIKPVTGSWVSTTDGGFVFLIETGERRFWAACLRAAAQSLTDEPLLRVEVIVHPSRQRQVLENRHAEAPSAVGQACEISALILAEMGVEPAADQSLGDEFDFFRAARSQRMPVGLWERIMPVMQLTRPRMVQLLNILQLPTPLLELADRFRLPERVLREILALSPDQWERMLRLSIQNSLTSEDIAEWTAAPEVTPESKSAKRIPAPAGHVAAKNLRRLTSLLRTLERIDLEQALDETADELVGSGDADDLLAFLDELNTLIRARLTRM